MTITVLLGVEDPRVQDILVELRNSIVRLLTEGPYSNIDEAIEDAVSRLTDNEDSDSE